MNDPLIPYGKAYAIRILVGRDLQLNPSYVEEAEKYLSTGKLNPILTIPFLTESMRMVELINQKGLLITAQSLSEKYLNDQKYNP